MPTKHGKKSKPVFKIVGWKNANARPTDTANHRVQSPGGIKPIITSGPSRRWLVLKPPPFRAARRSHDGPEIDDDSQTLFEKRDPPG